MHTPGPWRYESESEYQTVVYGWNNPGESSVIVATIEGEDGNPPEPWQIENARLIAAAPELLAALQEIAAWVPSAAPDEPGGMSIVDAIDIARAAIAKAVGNQAGCPA